MAKKGMSKGAKIGLGVGAGLAAAAAAAYFLTGARGKKNRKKVKEWSGKIQQQVGKELAKLKKASAEDYQAVLNEAIKRYKGLEAHAPGRAPAKKRAAAKRK